MKSNWNDVDAPLHSPSIISNPFLHDLQALLPGPVHSNSHDSSHAEINVKYQYKSMRKMNKTITKL